MDQKGYGHFNNGGDVWVMAGQSNMEGCGYLVESLASNPNVYCFTTRHKWTIAKDPLHDLIGSTAPIDWTLRKSMAPPEYQNKPEGEIRLYWKERAKGIGGGLGISFGTEYSAATGRPVGLISCAHGGTSLEQWSHRRKNEGLHSLYGAMLERIRLAGGNLRGILWYQGESDTTAEASVKYKKLFADWVDALRSDLHNPDLPIVTVQLGCVAAPNRSSADWDRIRTVQYEMPESISKLGVAAALDLKLNDTIHIDSPGLIRLGKRMARIALRLAENRRTIPMGPRFSSLGTKINQRGLGETEIVFSGAAGSLLPLRGIDGFSVLDSQMGNHKNAVVTATYRHPKKKNTVVVRTNIPLVDGDVIAYGRGFMPVCNLVDEADMAVCAFDKQI